MPSNENTEGIELLQKDFTHFMEINELQHEHIIEKLDDLHKKIVDKHIYCDKRFLDMDTEIEVLKEFKTSATAYTIAIAAMVTLILPVALDIFSKLFLR